MYSPWKLAFLRQHRIDMNWRSGDARPPKVGSRSLSSKIGLAWHLRALIWVVSVQLPSIGMEEASLVKGSQVEGGDVKGLIEPGERLSVEMTAQTDERRMPWEAPLSRFL